MNDLIAFYKQYFPNAAFTPIVHDDAMVAIVYHIDEADGTHAILKISPRPNDYYREKYFLDRFTGKIPVPKIIQIIPPSSKNYGAILMEFLPGKLLTIPELTKDLAYDLGIILAKIHVDRMPDYGDPVSSSLSQDPRNYITFKFEEGLEECSQGLSKQLLDKSRNYFSQNIDKLGAVDGPCIVHRDFRVGNFIVNHGKLQGVIDWAGARFSFAEEDLCEIEHAAWPKEMKAAFLTGYASIRTVPDYQRLLPFLRLNKAIATIGFLLKTQSWNTSGKDLYQSNLNFLENLLNVLH